jgi:membrane protein YdbS with pleckstrin-like domain
MKPDFILQQGEKMLLAVQPEKVYVYFGALALIRRMIFFMLVCTIAVMYFFHGKEIQINLTLGSLIHQTSFHYAIITLFGVILFIMIVSLYWANLIYQNSWYFFTDKRVVIYSGVFNINKDAYVYNRINDVDFRQYFFQRLFSLAVVILRTQGFLGVCVIQGLSKSNAEKVYQIVNEHLVK